MAPPAIFVDEGTTPVKEIVTPPVYAGPPVPVIAMFVLPVALVTPVLAMVLLKRLIPEPAEYVPAGPVTPPPEVIAAKPVTAVPNVNVKLFEFINCIVG